MNFFQRPAIIFVLFLSVLGASEAGAKVTKVKIHNLSTMGSDIFPSEKTKKLTYTHAEWGYAALIELDTTQGKKQILFDTGAYKETVAGNLEKLEIDFEAKHVVLSHFHADHTGGLTALKKKYPDYLNKLWVGDKILASRRVVKEGHPKEGEANTFIKEYENFKNVTTTATHKTQMISIDRSIVMREIDEDVMLLYRPSSRRFSDMNTKGNPYEYLGDDGQWRKDDLPEEISLVINTPEGLIIVSGCGHRGILNTADSALVEAKKIMETKYSQNIYALVGGFHLLGSDSPIKAKKFEGKTRPYNQIIAMMLDRWQTKLFWGSHCTGHQATENIFNYYFTKIHPPKDTKLGENVPIVDFNKGFRPDDAVKIIEGRAGQTFTYDSESPIPQVTKGFYR